MLKCARFFALLLAFPMAWSQTPELTFKGSWNRGFYTQLGHANDSTLVALYENGLDVFAIDEAGPMEHLGRMLLGTETPVHLSVTEEMAVVATEKRVLLIDIGNPQEPTVISEISEMTTATYLDGSTLFLFGEKIMRWDVGNPQLPQLLFEDRVLDPLRAGFTLNGRLFTVTESGVIDVFNLAPDGRLVPRFDNAASSIAPAKIVAFGGDRIFLSHSDYIPFSIFTGIHSYKIEADGQVKPQGTVYPDTNIEDLVVVGDRLIAAANNDEFQGLIFYDTDFEAERFQEGVRLEKPPFEAIHAVNDQLFFGVSDEQGLQQFRPNASYSETASFESPSLAQDAAFRDPFVFLASAGKLEVVSFEEPETPTLVATYPHTLFGSHKLLLENDELYLSHSAGIRRFQVEPDGTLTFLDEFLLFGLDPVQAMKQVDGRFYVATERLFLEISPNGVTRKTFPSPILDPAYNFSEVAIQPPYVFKRRRVNIEWFSFQEEGPLTRVNSLQLNRLAEPRPYPITLNDKLFIAGSYVFNAEDATNLKELPRVDLELEDTRLVKDLLFGVGPKGLQIWDFKRPEAPRVLWEQSDVAGSKLLIEDNTLVVFNSTPNELSYFTYRVDDTQTFFPLVNAAADEQLIFHNSREEAARLTLEARFQAGENRQVSVEIGPSETLSFETHELFPSEEGYSLTISSPPRVKTTYRRKGQGGSDRNVSPSLASGFDVASLSNQLVLNVPGSPSQNRVAIASPDETASFQVQLQFLTEAGVLEEKVALLDEKVGIVASVEQIFDTVQPGQPGTIRVTSPQGTRVAGMVYAEASVAAEATARAFSVNSRQSNPVRTEQLTSYGFGDSFDHMTIHEDDLLLSGNSGLLLASKSGDSARPVSQHAVLDATLDDENMWVLTNKALDVRPRSEDRVLSQVANQIDANRLRRVGDDLFMWHDEKPSLQIATMTAPDQIEKVAVLALKGAWPADALRVGDQLVVATNQGLQIYAWEPFGQPVYVGTMMPNTVFGLLSFHDGALIAEAGQKILNFQPSAQGMPQFVSEHEFVGELLAMRKGKGIFYINRRSFAIQNLTDNTGYRAIGSVQHTSVRGARFSESRLWVNTYFNGIFGYDIEDPENPVLIKQIEALSSFSCLAEADSRVYATGFHNGDLVIGEIPPSGQAHPSEFFNLGRGFPIGMVAKGAYAYLASSRQGLLTVRFDPTLGPRLIDTEAGAPTAFDGNENLLVTAGDDSLKVYSLQNSVIPQFLGDIPPPYRIIREVALDGNWLLAAGGDSRLSIFDLSNPRAPRIVSEITLPTNFPRLSSVRMTALNQHAYILFGFNLLTVDFSNPEDPQIVSRLPTQSYRIDMLGGYLFLRENLDSVVYDLSNPKQPTLLSKLENMEMYSAVLNGDILWNVGGFKLQSFRFSPVRATIPWVASNSQFQTRIQISNASAQDQAVKLRAVAPDGTIQEVPIQLAALSMNEWAAEELFPELKGYSVTVESASSEVNASFATGALSSDAGKAGFAFANATPAGSLQDGLVFNFPDGTTAAFAISAPFSTIHQTVLLEVHGPNGLMGQSQIELSKDRPAVQLVKTLFPQVDDHEPFTIIATSTNGSRLSGTTFIFNEEGLPAAVEASPESTLFLTRNPGQD